MKKSETKQRYDWSDERKGKPALNGGCLEWHDEITKMEKGYKKKHDIEMFQCYTF